MYWCLVCSTAISARSVIESFVFRICSESFHSLYRFFFDCLFFSLIFRSVWPRRNLPGYCKCFSSACNIRWTIGLNLWSLLRSVPLYIRLALFGGVLPVLSPNKIFLIACSFSVQPFCVTSYPLINGAIWILSSRLENYRNFSNHCLSGVKTGLPSESLCFKGRYNVSFGHC